MSLCDHFVYTTAEIESRTDYQVIAKSPGVDEGIISELSDYLYPIGVNPTEFKESRSLVLLANRKVAYSIVKNIGIGYDGRDNTFYNHTMILSMDVFKKIDYDSKILDNYYVENIHLRNVLQPLIVEWPKQKLDFSVVVKLKPEVLEQILSALFKKKKIAIFDNTPNLIRDILSVVPPSLRLISFSTLVVQPSRQQKYEFIQMAKQNITLSDDFVIIDPKEIAPSKQDERQDIFEMSMKYYVNVIVSMNEQQLKDIHQNFENIPGDDFKDKIIMVINYEQLKHSFDEKVRLKIFYNLLEMLNKTDPQTSFEYLDKIKDYVKDINIEEHLSQLEILKITKEFQNAPLNIYAINKMFGELRTESSESRIKLLSHMLVSRKDEFIKNGPEILANSSYLLLTRQEDLFRFFVENNPLHPCIIKFIHNSNTTPYTGQEVFEKIVLAALRYNIDFIPELIKQPVFDFEKLYDLLQFESLIRKIYSSIEFRSATSNTILLTTRLVRSLVENAIMKILQTKDEDKRYVREFVEVAKILKDFMKIKLESKVRSFDEKNELQHELNMMEDFIKKYSYQKKPERVRF